MGEEAYEETRFVTDSGTIIVRGGYGREHVWLGLSPGQNTDDDPDVVVKLGAGLIRRLCAALGEMEEASLDELKEALTDASDAIDRLEEAL